MTRSFARTVGIFLPPSPSRNNMNAVRRRPQGESSKSLNSGATGVEGLSIWSIPVRCLTATTVPWRRIDRGPQSCSIARSAPREPGRTVDKQYLVERVWPDTSRRSQSDAEHLRIETGAGRLTVRRHDTFPRSLAVGIDSSAARQRSLRIQRRRTVRVLTARRV